MPTYEYKCPKCGNTIEIVQSINNRIAPLCFNEGCEETQMETVIGCTSFILKGGCWAKDGYSSKR